MLLAIGNILFGFVHRSSFNYSLKSAYFTTIAPLLTTHGCSACAWNGKQNYLDRTGDASGRGYDDAPHMYPRLRLPVQHQQFVLEISPIWQVWRLHRYQWGSIGFSDVWIAYYFHINILVQSIMFILLMSLRSHATIILLSCVGATERALQASRPLRISYYQRRRALRHTYVSFSAPERESVWLSIDRLTGLSIELICFNCQSMLPEVVIWWLQELRSLQFRSRTSTPPLCLIIISNNWTAPKV